MCLHFLKNRHNTPHCAYGARGGRDFKGRQKASPDSLMKIRDDTRHFFASDLGILFG